MENRKENHLLSWMWGSFAVALALLLNVSIVYAGEGVTGYVPTPPSSDVIAPVVVQPFNKLNVFASGTITAAPVSSTNCPDVTCDGGSGTCTGCFTFSSLPLKGGLAGATLTGEFIFEDALVSGDCWNTHGIATATAKAFSIKFGVSGWSCYQSDISSNDLQFTGNYVVVSGTGTYATAAGTGAFVTDFPDLFANPPTRSLTLDGTLQK